MLDVPVLTGLVPALDSSAWRVVCADRAQTDAYRAIRRDVFVGEQGLFSAHDHDRLDDDPRTVVLVALAPDGEVLGGVRLAPATEDRDLGWWTGSRLVVRHNARHAGGIGSALVRAACAMALNSGVLRFEATVQPANEVMFRRLGWQVWGETRVAGARHLRMRWPIERIAHLVQATKRPLQDVIGDLRDDDENSLGGDGFVGDDGAPVPGTDVIAACDAILPGMIERDPEWAGWCGVLVNANDLAAMGAEPVGLLDAIGAPTASFARRVVNGLRSAAQAWGIPVLGGHTQLGVAPALTVTALGRTASPVPGGGAKVGDELALTVDLHGQWRRGFEGRQWDSTSSRSGAELRTQAGLVRNAHPAAAKDVSMAGIVGTAAMLAEASGVGATLDLAAVPTPGGARFADWLTCFPGFGMLTADRPGDSRMVVPRGDLATTANVGRFTTTPGVRLRWPDGVETMAVPAEATGLGPAVRSLT